MSASPTLFDLRKQHPGKILREMMEARCWAQEELAAITGLSRQTIYNLLSGKTNVSPETAAKLGAAFGNTAEEWIKWDGLYRLSILDAQEDLSKVERLARLYEIAPIREMQRRGWISLTSDAVALEADLATFFGSNPLDCEIQLPIAARRTIRLSELNPAEKAWCFRALHLSKIVPVKPFAKSSLKTAEKKLRALAAFPKETRKVPLVLAEAGIRFVVVEPLQGAKMDGATMWLGDEPVIALSIRDDRIDNFWFTLMHEFSHVKNGDASVDKNLVDGVKGVLVSLADDEVENRANTEAANSLIKEAELNSFIRRVGPFYSRDRVIQFANKIKIHPGIILGQLQHREELGYSALREFLVKVRDHVVSTSLTDGWGQVIGSNGF